MSLYGADGRARGKACLWWARADVEASVRRSPLSASTPGGEPAWFAAWWPTFSKGRAWRRDVAVAYEPATDTARELASAVVVEGRACLADPGLRATEIPGAVDLLLVERFGGKKSAIPAEQDLGDVSIEILSVRAGALAEHLPELLHGATCLARLYGKPAKRIRVGIVQRLGDRVVADWRELAPLDVEVAAAEMRRELATIASEPPPEPGPQCALCPARGVCPTSAEYQAAVARSLRLPALVQSGPFRHPADVRITLETLPMLRAWCAEREREAQRFADEHGAVDMGDGLAYSGLDVEREAIDVEVPGAHRALMTLDPDDAGHVALVREPPVVTVAGIERAAIASAPRGEAAALAARTMQALRDAGAVSVTIAREYATRNEA